MLPVIDLKIPLLKKVNIKKYQPWFSLGNGYMEFCYTILFTALFEIFHNKNLKKFSGGVIIIVSQVLFEIKWNNYNSYLYFSN